MRSGAARRVADSWLQIAPAAGLVSTAPDMARFMIALLKGGRLGERSILKQETVETMESVQFTAHPEVPGTCFGLFESLYFNRRQLYHPGGVRGFGALLYLYPEARLGIFFADNGSDPDLGWLVVDPIVARFFPGSPRTPATTPDVAGRLRAFEGTYRSVKYSHDTLERVALLRGSALPVSTRRDGALLIGGVPFAELRPAAFQEIDGYERAGFVSEGSDPARFLYLGWQAFERVPWFERSFVQRPLLLLFFASFAWGSFLAPASAPEAPLRSLRAAHRAARVVALLDLIFLIGLVLGFVGTAPGDLWTGWPAAIRILLCLPLLAAALAFLVLAPLAGLVLLGANVSLGTKLRLAIFTSSALGFVPFLHHWNLLGFRL